MSINSHVIVTFPIYDQFGAIRKQNSRRIACKTYIFINSNWKQNWKMSNLALALLFWVKVLFYQKCWFFTKNADISKIEKVLVIKGIFSEATYGCALLRTKFQVSSIMLTSFRKGR